MPVYLLCFDKKFRHAKHYIGFVQNMEGLPKRLNHHKKGTGSRLMAAVAKAGIAFCVARTWPDGDRNFERKLKNRKKSSELCPHCTAAKKETARRKKVLAQEQVTIAKLNAPPIVCPVIEVAKSITLDPTIVGPGGSLEGRTLSSVADEAFNGDPSVQELIDKAKEITDAQSQSDTNPSRWKRIWSCVSRLWLVLKDKLVSK